MRSPELPIRDLQRRGPVCPAPEDMALASLRAGALGAAATAVLAAAISVAGTPVDRVLTLVLDRTLVLSPGAGRLLAGVAVHLLVAVAAGAPLMVALVLNAQRRRPTPSWLLGGLYGLLLHAAVLGVAAPATLGDATGWRDVAGIPLAALAVHLTFGVVVGFVGQRFAATVAGPSPR